MRLSVASARPPAGGELAYGEQIVDAGGAPVRGGILLEIEALGPDGKPVSRYTRACAPLTGIESASVPVPVNAARGTYRLRGRLPQTGAGAEARFSVR